MHEQILRSLSLLSLLALPVMTAAAASAATPICSGVRIPIDTSVFSKPFANLALGGNEGDFLIDTGATYSQIDMRRYAVPDGIKIVLSGFSLPLAEGGVFTAADLSSFATPLGAQLGIVGTDFLSLRTIEFHYEWSQSFLRWGGKHATRPRCDGLVLPRPAYQATTERIRAISSAACPMFRSSNSVQDRQPLNSLKLGSGGTSDQFVSPMCPMAA
jgi:hypothetical protein